MSFTTQIGGECSPNNKSIFSLKQKLLQSNVRVTHPLSDGFIFSADNIALTFDPKLWSVYEAWLDYYQSIATCDFHTVCNQPNEDLGHIGPETAMEIMYAMLKSKPIVLLSPAVFMNELDSFSKKVISKNLDKLIICNLLEKDIKELPVISNQTVDYELTDHEIALIRSRIRGQFRQMLESSKTPNKNQTLTRVG